jgi:hypothetical protein
MDEYEQILYDIEVHADQEIRKYFEEIGDPNEIMPDGTPLFTIMVEMYTRTPRFKNCVQAFIDAGLEFEEKELLAVFADDAKKLKELLLADQSLVYKPIRNTIIPIRP